MPERSSPGGEPTIDAQLSPAPTTAEQDPPAPAAIQTRRWWALGGVGLIAAAVVVLDQISKAGVVQQWGPDATSHHLPLVPGILELDYVENRGAAFGLLPNAGWGLAIIAAVAIGVILYLVPRLQARPHGAPWHMLLALGLVLGGALGNLIDRLQHGYVVDFITPRFAQMALGGTLYRFPTFNVADSAITVGVLLLFVGFLRLPEEPAGKRQALGPQTDQAAN